ncbi:hypothetical protein [Pseudonocardia charpentierae]|uniref:Secreted protein with PEP-CTERM sorting signal n=1 Tax=Pseudonocardia charpentierae TaxID=3075545 RepID=A0ABU2NHS7_9PSEU|nr:hypothetical protein [Pseudonocardia sp. DSM 45834]MDT0353449.1 hypothetical protein [Pseudonocardia sp. DSM 45834]
MSVVIIAVSCGALLLVAGVGGYVAGTRRRPPRHGSVQLRAPRRRR